MAKPMSIPHPIVDRNVLAVLRLKIKRRAELGYTDVPVSAPWLEQLLDMAEKQVGNA